MHTSLDEETLIPEIVNIAEAKLHDRHGLKQLVYIEKTIVVEDRAYFDFELMKNRRWKCF